MGESVRKNRRCFLKPVLIVLVSEREREKCVGEKSSGKNRGRKM